MSHLELWFLAIGLAMDCFAIAIARGLMFKRIQLNEMLGIAFLFGITPVILSFFGWCTSYSFSHYIESIDHWIVFIILFVLGAQMIKEYYDEREGIKPCKKCTNLKVLFLLALATSVDAFAVGLSWALLKMDGFVQIFYSLTVVGLVSFIFSLFGLFIGYWSQKKSHYLRNLPIKLLGGSVLILIGGKILIEHLCY